jgi:hypothetical protein
MPLTAGLIISLTHDCVAADLRERLSGREGLTLGEQERRWLPAAIEAEDAGALRALHDWIAAQPGVAFVDVVHVHFEDPATNPIL